MKFSWSLAPSQPLLAGRLASALAVPPLLAQCLLNRGLSELPSIENFLAPRLKQLSDPFLLPGMDQAVQRLFRAREENENIVIFGDYAGDQLLAAALDLPRPGPGEFVSARLARRSSGHDPYVRSVRLEGADWLLAAAGDPAGPAPALPR